MRIRKKIIGLKRKRHGTRYCYVVRGCRCDKCTDANTAYQNSRNAHKKAAK